MNLKQIVKNVSDTIKRKRGEKTDEDYEESSLDEEEEEEALTPEQEAEMEIDSPEGNKSMLKGDHGKIFGVSKPVVIGVGVFFLVVFMLAFIYASSDSSKPDKPSTTQDMKTQIAAEDSSINGKDGELADDYGDLHRANEKKKAGRTQQNGQNTAETVQATHNSPAATAPASSTVSSSPQISQVPRASVVVPSAVAPASYPTSYARNYSLPSEDSAPAEVAPAKQTAAASTSIVDKVKESPFSVALREGALLRPTAELPEALPLHPLPPRYRAQTAAAPTPQRQTTPSRQEPLSQPCSLPASTRTFLARSQRRSWQMSMMPVA